MRALNLALACETGDDSDPSPYFTVGGVLSEQEASELMGRLDRDRNGRVSWEGFVEYFSDAVHGEEGGGRGGWNPEPWFQLEVDIAEKLLQQMEAQGGSTARRAWVNSLRRRFQTADIHETGTLIRYCTYNTFFYHPTIFSIPQTIAGGSRAPRPTPHRPPRMSVGPFYHSFLPPYPSCSLPSRHSLFFTCRSSHPPFISDCLFSGSGS